MDAPTPAGATCLVDLRARRGIRRRAGSAGVPPRRDLDRAPACAGRRHLRAAPRSLVLDRRPTAPPVRAQLRHLHGIRQHHRTAVRHRPYPLEPLAGALGGGGAGARSSVHGGGWLQLALPQPLPPASGPPALILWGERRALNSVAALRP